ncbi:MAG: RNAse P subunit p30 [Candidatus Aramenus sulfurataquae]|uniref:RNAse P subunit p30 n=1 Tax=Candidatus Aramenus sulfurataquae TaxID=1326980 RepID=W7KIX0_9CREN|nr:MAG: RNAse P subunit p30 [Candidatus Aramenus sulfurataquae]
MLVETCIKNPALFPILKKIGYSEGILEEVNSQSRWRRVTIPFSDPEGFRRRASSFEKNVLVFAKPLNRQALRYALSQERVIAITIDNDNWMLLTRRASLNMIRQQGKLVEVYMSASSGIIFKVIPLAYKWFNVVFSSCASDMTQLWPPLSKVNYLVIHGADEEEAIRWVYDNPSKLLLYASS